MAEKSSATEGTLHTNERIVNAGHDYHEKNGLRIDTDDVDHDREPPVSLP